MKISIKVMPKNEVLDSQGRAILNILNKDYKNIENCSIGKWIDLEINEESKDKAIEIAQKVANELLHNSLIEDFTIES